MYMVAKALYWFALLVEVVIILINIPYLASFRQGHAPVERKHKIYPQQNVAMTVLSIVLAVVSCAFHIAGVSTLARFASTSWARVQPVLEAVRAGHAGKQPAESGRGEVVKRAQCASLLLLGSACDHQRPCKPTCSPVCRIRRSLLLCSQLTPSSASARHSAHAASTADALSPCRLNGSKAAVAHVAQVRRHTSTRHVPCTHLGTSPRFVCATPQLPAQRSALQALAARALEAAHC
jgi:hypothetical protein